MLVVKGWNPHSISDNSKYDNYVQLRSSTGWLDAPFTVNRCAGSWQQHQYWTPLSVSLVLLNNCTQSAPQLNCSETSPACFWGLVADRWRHRNRSKRKTLCGGEGSYRGLRVEGRGAMLERVGTVAFRGGGGGSLTHAPHWLDGPWSSLWGNNAVFDKDDVNHYSLLALERMRTQNEGMTVEW